jgi:hypothetical protein
LAICSSGLRRNSPWINPRAGMMREMCKVSPLQWERSFVMLYIIANWE